MYNFSATLKKSIKKPDVATVEQGNNRNRQLTNKKVEKQQSN
jgi:hypothetical protein